MLYCAIQSLKVCGEKKHGVFLHIAPAAIWSIIGNEEKPFVTSLQSRRLISVQVSFSSSSISVVLRIKNGENTERGKKIE
jgi:hypothetical protein